MAGSGTPIRRLVPVFVDPDHLSDFQEALRLVSQPTHQQRTPDSQDNVIVDTSNLQLLLRHLGHRTPQQSRSEVHADAYLDGHDPTSDGEGLTSAFSRLSTSVNSSPVRSLAARTVPRVSARSNLSTPANTAASTSDALSLPLGVRTAPHTAGMSPQTSPRKKKYYVIIVGKCTGIYYDHW